MDELDVKDVFGRLLTTRPPMPANLDRGAVLGAGQRALRRRRAVRTGAGSALVAAALTAGTMAGPQLLAGGRRSGGGPAAGGVAAGPTTPVRPATSPPMPATGPALSEAELCLPAGIPQAPPGRSATGAPLPSVASVIAAVRAAARRVAPDARVTYVHAWDEPVSPKSGEPRVVVWFDVADRNGLGGMDFEIYPFRGVAPARLADAIVADRPYSNCTAPERRTEPDGSAGVIYRKPLGKYVRYPDDVVVRASYFSAHGVQVNVRAVTFGESVLRAAELRHPNEGVPNPPATRRTLPLTPRQVYEFARVAGALPVNG
jgi:hypothetical protein